MNPNLIQQIKSMYTQGASLKTIARELSLSHSKVHRTLIAEGVDRRPSRCSIAGTVVRDKDSGEVWASVADCAAALGVAYETVRAALHGEFALCAGRRLEYVGRRRKVDKTKRLPRVLRDLDNGAEFKDPWDLADTLGCTYLDVMIHLRGETERLCGRRFGYTAPAQQLVAAA